MQLVFNINYPTLNILIGGRILLFILPLPVSLAWRWTSTAVVFSILFPLFFLSTSLTFVVGVPGITSSNRAWGSESIRTWVGWGSTSSPAPDEGTSSPSPCVAGSPRCIWTRCTGTCTRGSVRPLGCFIFVSDVLCSVSYLFIRILGSWWRISWSGWRIVKRALFVNLIDFNDGVTWRI